MPSSPVTPSFKRVVVVERTLFHMAILGATSGRVFLLRDRGHHMRVVHAPACDLATTNREFPKRQMLICSRRYITSEGFFVLEIVSEIGLLLRVEHHQNSNLKIN